TPARRRAPARAAWHTRRERPPGKDSTTVGMQTSATSAGILRRQGRRGARRVTGGCEAGRAAGGGERGGANDRPDSWLNAAVAPNRTEDPGIGTRFDRPLERMLGPDGAFAVDRVGEARGVREGFIALATMPAPRLLAIIIATYLSFNLTFGSLYMTIGVEHLG